jgi:hypothetical protein
MQIPDYISPIVAYRTWQWGAEGLQSLNNLSWVPKQPMKANCPRQRCGYNPKTGGWINDSPAETCTCGIYAAKNHQHLVDTGYAGELHVCVHGEVNLWGKIWEHQLGYRAEYAYPRNLTISVAPLPTTKVVVSPFFTIRGVMARLEKLVEFGVDVSFASHESCERMPVWSPEFGFERRGLEHLEAISLDIVVGSVLWLSRKMGHQIDPNNWLRAKSDHRNNCARCGQLVAITSRGESWGDALERVCPHLLDAA